MKTWMLAALALAAAPAAAVAQEGPARASPQDLEEAFYRAFYAESGLRDFEKGADAYGKVADAAKAAGRKDLLVKALLGRGRCLRTMGRVDDAKAAFGMVLEADPENAEAKQALDAAGSPAAIEHELRDRIAGLVLSLAGPAQEQAREDLHRIGARAISALEVGLRSLEVGVAAGAADVLGRMDASGARAALARAINDPKVTFPRVIAESLATIRDWNQEADAEGRLLLLRQVLGIPDRDLRMKSVEWLMGKGFGPKQAQDVAAVVAAALEGADRESAKMLLGTWWGPEANRELFLRVRSLLRSPDAEVRSLAVRLAAYGPKELAPEDAEALLGLLETGSPADRLQAFWVLDFRSLLAEPARGLAFSRLLSDDDPATVKWAVEYILNKNQYGSVVLRWSPSFTPGLLAALRKAVEGAYDDNLVQALAGLISRGAKDLPDDDLVDLVARVEDKQQTPGNHQVAEHSVQVVAARYRQSSDPEAVSAAFLKGLRRLDGSGRDRWRAKWSGIESLFTPEVLEVLLSEPSPPTAHIWAYSEIALRSKSQPVPATPGVIRSIGADLLSLEGTVAGMARQVAERYACPELGPALRTLLERTTDGAAANRLLGLLVACVGKEAVPDLREHLHRNWSGEVRDLLVRVAGKDALPELLRAAEAGMDPVWILGTFSGKWNAGVPREVVDAFLDRLPAERRTPGVVQYVLGAASPDRRARIVQECLDPGDPALVARAAEAVRKFNMTDLWPRLVPLLDHADESVRKEAQESLDAIRRTRDLKASFERFGEGGAGKALDDARALAGSPQAAKRRAAALALGALGDPAGVPALLKLVDDSDASVRDAALAALERLGGRPKVEEGK